MINHQIWGIFYFSDTHKKLVFHTGTSFFADFFGHHQPDTKGPKESEASVNGIDQARASKRYPTKIAGFHGCLLFFFPQNMVIIW